MSVLANRSVASGGIGGEFGLSHRGGYRTAWNSRPPIGHFERVSLTSNGRATLGLIVRYARRMPSNRRDTILLPSYLCHSMIQPFLELGLQVRFYPVASDLSINPAEICSRIDDRTLAVLLMNYFGFHRPGDMAALLTNRFPHVTIIDDRTHMLLSDLNMGVSPSDSAIVTYSPRKWGPFPDLGIVLWPRPSSDSGLRNCLLDHGYDLHFVFWRLWGMLLRTMFFAYPAEVLRRLSLRPLHKADAILDQRMQIRHASPISRWLWRSWDWVAAWNVRRENYRYLFENWPSADMRPLFGKLPESVCPLGFPIRTAERARVKRCFISRRIFPPIHWLRPPQVSPDEFHEAATLAEQELTVPIDQRYGLRHMDYILETVCRA
jgi:hypothetical protein